MMPLSGVIPGMLLLTIIYHMWRTPEVAGIGAANYPGGGFLLGLIPAAVCGFSDSLLERRRVDNRAVWIGLIGACTGLVMTFILSGKLPMVAAFCCAVPAFVCSLLCSWLSHQNAQETLRSSSAPQHSRDASKLSPS